jgi:hypothetical protein
VMADADRQPAMLDREGAERGLMRGNEVPGSAQKRISFRGQPDQPRRPLDQATAKTVFESFDLQAYRGLRAVHRLRRAREAVEIGHQDKCLNRLDIERFHNLPFKSKIIEILFHMISQWSSGRYISTCASETKE